MGEFGQTLKKWRQHQSFSQLGLSMEADISSKHISFLETGRAHPSREMVMHLCQILDIPLAERNILLRQAGFSEAFSRLPLDDVRMQPVREALETLLTNQNPYPAMVLDWDWNVLMANQAQQMLTQVVSQNQPNFPDTRNLMELTFDPNGFRPYITNWDEVATFLLQRIKKEQAMYQDRHSTLLERLKQFEGVTQLSKTSAIAAPNMPMLTIDLELNGLSMSMFSTLSTFGSAVDVTMQELIIEQYFPADETTKAFFQQFQT